MKSLFAQKMQRLRKFLAVLPCRCPDLLFQAGFSLIVSRLDNWLICAEKKKGEVQWRSSHSFSILYGFIILYNSFPSRAQEWSCLCSLVLGPIVSGTVVYWHSLLSELKQTNKQTKINLSRSYSWMHWENIYLQLPFISCLPSSGVWVLFLLYPFFLCHSSTFGYCVLNFSYSLLFCLRLVRLPFLLQIDTGYISALSG